jgi:hypothetical protein
LVTLVDRQIVEPDLGGDAAAAVDVEVGGGAQAIVVDRTGPGAHQKRRTDGDSSKGTTWQRVVGVTH